ncbi:MAG: T9SS type A sorting domain-containing protein [Bacteroidetes bacterium]|nr:T9SS type A sorting domain-containing protein [Bacteroidota bacterium]
MKKLLLCILTVLLFQQVNAQPLNTNLSNGVIFDGEPYIALNPANNKNLVAAWMGMKFSSGMFRIAIKTRASFDGGNTWSTVNPLPHVVTAYTSADVSMAFDKTGLLYLSYIDSRQAPDSGGVYVVRSSDGGSNWDAPSKAFDAYDVTAKLPIDSPWLVVDNSNTANSGTLYITTKPAPWIAPPNRNYYKVSSDSGHSWSAIANVDGGTHLVGNAIAAPMAAPATTMNGKFCAVYPSYVVSQNILPAYYLAASSDKGQTFSYTTVYAASPAALDTNCKNGYRLVANPNDSNQMIFLSPTGANGDADIMAFHSNNGGQTWSSPVRVNDDAVGNGKIQDMVWATYNEQGNAAVTWRDRRNSAVNGFWNSDYDFYYAISIDNGQTFSANQKLSSQLVAFDSILTQNGNDFMSCVYLSDTLYTVWGDTRNGKMNIYFSKSIASSNTNIGITLLDGEEPSFMIFPNPGNEQMNVVVSDKFIGKQITISDESGKEVLTFSAIKQNEINISQLKSGIYFLKEKSNNNTYTQKFVKQQQDR